LDAEAIGEVQSQDEGAVLSGVVAAGHPREAAVAGMGSWMEAAAEAVECRTEGVVVVVVL
jgi:hypothetical protein